MLNNIGIGNPEMFEYLKDKLQENDLLVVCELMFLVSEILKKYL
jgi:hypothetical protein